MLNNLRLCQNCRHRGIDPDDETWEFCDRPNYPPGKWNMMTRVQRYSEDTKNPNLCLGKYWQPMERDG